MGLSCGKPREALQLQRGIESQALYWTAPMVGSWIDLIGLNYYKHIFLENGVDGPTLLELRRDQFERCLGLTNPLHEMSLRYALLDLKTKMYDYTKWEWTCAGVLEWLSMRGLECLVSRFTAAAVHGGVLFKLRKQDFAAKLFVGEQDESELVLDSLWFAVERARKYGFHVDPDSYLDWGPVEVRKWLETIHLGHLNDLFREHAVNGTLLPHLDHVALRRTMKLTEVQTLVVSKAVKRLTQPRGGRGGRRRSSAGGGGAGKENGIARARTVRPSTSTTKSRYSDAAYSIDDSDADELTLGDRTNTF